MIRTELRTLVLCLFYPFVQRWLRIVTMFSVCINGGVSSPVSVRPGCLRTKGALRPDSWRIIWPCWSLQAYMSRISIPGRLCSSRWRQQGMHNRFSAFKLVD